MSCLATRHSVDDPHTLGRQPLAQPGEQRIVERNPPVVRKLQLAGYTAVAILEHNRTRALAKRKQELGETLNLRIAVARNAQAFGEALANRRKAIDVLGDDAQPLRLSIVRHSLRNLDVGD